jgi:hypothetical protein
MLHTSRVCRVLAQVACARIWMILAIDFAAEAALCGGGASSATRRTSWRFLDTFECHGVPPKIAAFIRDTTATLCTTRARAGEMLRGGVLGEYEAMLDICASIEERRAQAMGASATLDLPPSGLPRSARYLALRAACPSLTDSSSE